MLYDSKTMDLCRLAYLHEDVEPKILHGSLTSTNILLDRQWNPEISDFGLAKLFTAEWTLNNMETMGSVSLLDKILNIIHLPEII